MKILLATDRYPPAPGGTEIHVRTLARTVRDHGITVEVAVLGDEDATRDDQGIPVHVLGGWTRRLASPSPRFHPPAPDPSMVPRLRRIARHADVVHAHGWIAFSALAAHLDAPVVVTLHDYGFWCVRRDLRRDGRRCDGPSGACASCALHTYGALRGPASAAALRGARPLLRRAAAIVANSATVAENARRHLGLEVHTVPTFLSSGPAGPRPEFVPTGDYLVAAGALAPHKGSAELLDAYERSGVTTPLVLIGSGELPHRLPPGAAAVGPRTHDEVRAALAHASVALATPVYEEPLGLVALEAMELGTPVIATSVGGLAETVVHDGCGLLIAPGDRHALAEAIRALDGDEALRRRLGSAGPRRAGDFDGYERLAGLYESVQSRPFVGST